jgi:Outer membrane protein beta-barrel domain
MRAATKLASVVVLVGLAATAQAQQFHQFLPDRDSKEVDFSASFNFDPVDSQAVFGRLGYFFNRNIQVGVDGAFTRIENGTTSKIWNLGVFANWHFPGTTPLLPYVGAFAGVADASGVDASNSWGAQGGVKYFFNPSVAGFGELRWRDIEDADDQLGVFFGLSIFFR